MAKFYICKRCGNLVGVIHDSGVPMMCCGQKMEPLEINDKDAAGEKHLPVCTQEGDILTVNVGSVDHPMTEKHLIEWIYVETEHGGQRKVLTAEDKPTASFCLKDDKAIAVYAYCNLHGLWRVEL